MTRSPGCGSSRIIPARAGFTEGFDFAQWMAGDHPRSRGVYPNQTRPFCWFPGSSPLARGLLSRRLSSGDLCRIIPARAGFTAVTRSTGMPLKDHPRSRGVYAAPSVPKGGRPGSSPLARGLLWPADARERADRIIPARAGFTRLDLQHGLALGDHPRSRGVYTPRPLMRRSSLGSSPLARGLHLAIGVIPTVGHPTRGRSPSLVT